MNHDKIKFALIGCGAIAEKHATAIRNLPDAEIVGAYDINGAVAKAFCEKHAIPWYGNVEEMVEKADPQVFDILTVSGMHARNMVELLRFNRHFVVEKPFALRLDHIDYIIDECARRNVKIFVVKQNRFNPPVRKLKEALDRGRFGKLALGTVRLRWRREQAYYDQKKWRGTWALDGGVLTNQASHHIDMLIWMMGEVESVMAKTALRLVNIEAEDTAVAILKFRNGALGVIEATTAARPKDMEGSISVLGEKGAVEIGGFFMNELKTWNFAEPDAMDVDIWENCAKTPAIPAWNHTEFFRDVVESLRQNRHGLIDGVEGRKSVELMNAVYESAERGKEIFLRFNPQKSRLGVENHDQQRSDYTSERTVGTQLHGGSIRDYRGTAPGM